MELMVQLITAFIGSMGFALLFNTRKERILPASLGGLMEWGIYLLSARYVAGDFISGLIASAFSAVYAEVLARYFKAPATVFFIPAMVPLMPGGSLYYTMSYTVQEEWAMAREYGFATAQCALSISVGISLVWSANHMLHSVLMRKNLKKGEK